ncbi:ankyrin repeat protein [Helicobacter fennelliae]|nr:ankyrin repeat domain-containing protein [Helicobacter fennelliae]STQ84372.1 ankyrin repeat protein [Helicobacter fennelliae]
MSSVQNLTPQEYAKMEEFVKMSFDFARNNDADSLKIMLENGLNPNLANHKGDTLLMLASYHSAISCVKLLLDFGANVDVPNDRGHTPLAGVCFKGYAEVAKLLLESGANPNGFGETLSPINTAIMFRRKAILALLLQYNSKKLPLWKRLYAKLIGL